LHDWVRRWIDTPYDRLVDVGSAEGYYAVGMAYRCPSLRVSAYDGDALGSALLKRMARLNGVQDRVECKGFCREDDLQSELRTAQRPLLIIDCEGMEYDLLDPAAVQGLDRAALFVELHFFAHADITNVLKERFRNTHDIEHRVMRDRTLDDFPQSGCRWLDGASDKLKMYLMWEGRNERTEWLFMQPKCGVRSAPDPS
jgi:hypothetical protein